MSSNKIDTVNLQNTTVEILESANIPFVTFDEMSNNKKISKLFNNIIPDIIVKSDIYHYTSLPKKPCIITFNENKYSYTQYSITFEHIHIKDINLEYYKQTLFSHDHSKDDNYFIKQQQFVSALERKAEQLLDMTGL